MRKIKVLSTDNFKDPNLINALAQSGVDFLLVTATQSLRNLIYDSFAKEKSYEVKSFFKFRNYIFELLKSEDKVLASSDFRFLLNELIRREFIDKDEQNCFLNCKRQLLELFELLIDEEIDEVSEAALRNIGKDFTLPEEKIFSLYNKFRTIIRQECVDRNCKHYIHKFSELCRSEIKAFDTIVFSGFMFFNEEQKRFFKAALFAKKRILFINHETDFLTEKFYEPLAKEFNLEIEYSNIQTERTNSVLDFASQNIFTTSAAKIKNNGEIRIAEPFPTRNDEFKFIAKDIARLIAQQASEGRREFIESRLAIVFGPNKERFENQFDDVLKEYGYFELKAVPCTNVDWTELPRILYAKEGFLMLPVKLKGKAATILAKSKIFDENYNRLAANKKARPFIQYPYGQFILLTYKVVSKGLSVDDYKKLLYANWKFNAEYPQNDIHIKEFSKIQVFFADKASIEEWLGTIDDLINQKSKLVVDFGNQWHPLAKISAESLLFIKAHLSFIAKLTQGINKTRGKFADHLKALKQIFELELLAEDKDNPLQSQFVKTLIDIVNEFYSNNIFDVDAKYFSENISALLSEYELEVEESSDNFKLNIVNLENVIDYDYSYFPVFEADKYARRYNEEFPFNLNIKSILTDKNYGLKVGVNNNLFDIEQHLKFEKFIFKNTLAFTKKQITFSYCHSDNGRPMASSIYLRDLELLFENGVIRINSKEKAPTLKKIGADILRLDNKVKDCSLPDLLSYLICPKYFLHLNNARSELCFDEKFQLLFYMQAMVYYRFFEKFADEFKGKTFSDKTADFDAAKARVLDKVLAEIIPLFSFVEESNIKDVRSRILKQVELFCENNILSGKFKAEEFEFSISTQNKLTAADANIFIPKRVTVKSVKKNTSIDFDMTKNLDFLLSSSGGRKYEYKHYDEIINQLDKNLRSDDRLALVVFALFKISVQLSHDRYKQDGIDRINGLISAINASSPSTEASIPSGFCKYCKVKKICKDFVGEVR